MREVEPQELPTDWINTDIGSFAPLQRGFDLPNRERIDGKYPVVYSNGVMNYHHKYQVKGPGVVTGRSGTIGKAHYVEKDYWPHNTALWVKEFNNASPKFVYYLYSYIGFERFSSGSGVPTLNRNDAHSFAINVPENKEEQTAIANALSDVDALLSELENLIAKKQAIKTATMQQLLTGKTRLPQFAFYSDINSTEDAVEGKRKSTKPSELGEIPEDWEVYPMHKVIASNQLGGNYTNSESETEFPLIKMGNLDRGKIKLNKIEYVIGKVSQRDRLKSGDILFNTRNTLELVGKVAIWRNEMPEAYFNSNILRLKFDKTIVASNEYINAAMNTKTFITDLANVATGTTSVAAIYTRDLFQLNLLLPPKEEQTAIATIFSDMDNEIQTLEQRLSKTRQIKQGMMQELLTGRTRLPF
ncbi:restriction endonuclease subunit S [Shewanella ulleungensis]|uniref:restriction endonuclease subunit S n=1 Tax=Shewanella ulleungensis TaxID=2282699 RepID=UPI003D7B198D